MSDIAFYAPLKSPTHPTPSGDREMARNLMAVIGVGAQNGGQVRLMSELRLHETQGSTARQEGLKDLAKAEADRLITQLRDQDIALWVTYHNYYKAPDLLGPAVCAALNLPYVQIEASRAKQRLSGPWASFAAAAEAASDAAQVIFYMTEHDLLTLERDRTPDQKLVHLRPFLPQSTLPPAPAAPRETDLMLTTGMMRHGDKLASYTLIAEMLALMEHPNWRLEIAGDGLARKDIEALMRPFGDRVQFLGQLDRDQLSQAYDRAALFLWPGVNEGYGMVYLEAQATGLPVVAQDRPGVRDILVPAAYPTPSQGIAALAAMADDLLAKPDKRAQRGAQARTMISQRHLSDAATDTFWQAVAPLLTKVPR